MDSRNEAKIRSYPSIRYEKDFLAEWMVLIFLLFSYQRLICAACETDRSCEIQQMYRCMILTIKKVMLSCQSKVHYFIYKSFSKSILNRNIKV